MPAVSIVPVVTPAGLDELFVADPVVIVSDVIRATTTATTAIARGNRCIPVDSIATAHAEAAKHTDALLVGEQGGHPVPGFALGNSPAAVDTIRGRTVILLSTSGTPLLSGSRSAREVFVGCLRNTTATVNAASRSTRDVVFLAACTRGEFRDEDRLFGGWVARKLLERGYEAADELTAETEAHWGAAPPAALLGSASVAFLEREGHLEDLDFILTRIDDLSFSVRMVDGELVMSE